jgi:hypothetical protein
MCILKAMRNEVPKVNNLQRTTCRSSSCDEEPEKTDNSGSDAEFTGSR